PALRFSAFPSVHFVNSDLKLFIQSFISMYRGGQGRCTAVSTSICKTRWSSWRPSGRLEAVQLMGMMDDMLEKAGVDEQSEELAELSQLEGLLELVKVEQNIYNIVFHELIRQVSVGCAERGQLLAKLRQRYQSLLDRVPRRLKALHTEVVAQRALDRRLTEEIHHIKLTIQQLSMELSKIRDHDAFVSHQAEHAHWQLAEALKQTRTDSKLVISVKKLHLVSQLHISEQSWFKTAEHCILFLTSKDTECINIIMESTDYWRKQLAAFMAQLKQTEHAHCAQISAIQQGINKWLSFCSSDNKLPEPKYDKTSVEEIHADLQQWSNVRLVSLLCEHYQGEKQLNCQQTLGELGDIQERWLNMSLQLFSRHPSADGGPPEGQHAQTELDNELCELLRELDVQVNGDNGLHGNVMSLLGLMESWGSKLATVIEDPEKMAVSDWLELERALHSWKSLADEAFRHFSNKTDNKPDTSRSESGCFLCYQIRSVHVAQTRWMLELLLLVVPNHSEEENQEEEPHRYIPEISQETLDEDAQMLAEKLDRLSSYITSSCSLVLEEQVHLNTLSAQRECGDWVETCRILLTGVKGAPVELPVTPPAPVSSSGVSDCPADGSPVLNLINYDGNVAQRKLGARSVQLERTGELVVSPVTDDNQKAFKDLTTVGLLQQELHDSEVRAQIAEKRALEAEEALQEALKKIKDLERQLQGRPSVEPPIKPTSSSRKTKK
uniref:Axonemal dynein light chain domain containing 1 n=1 Tax=Neolamprologus brichardi TaxID=32507 RepID=A0A3Q4HZK6_NEOBR